MKADPSRPPRRRFLKQLGLGSAGLFFVGKGRAAEPQEKKLPLDFQVPRRKFGRHDFTVSSLCLGGMSLQRAGDEEAAKIVDAALAVGLNFFDNAWDYADGKAEELMGRLIEKRRDQVFLMTKVCSNHLGQGKERALKMLEDSLRRLRTDHLDLWQLHQLGSMAEVEAAYAPGGTLEALTEAKKQGKVRFIGFTGHADPNAHLAMLSRGFPFDSVQMPVNPLNDHHGRDFREKVIPEAVKQGIAPLAMKTMCGNAKPIIDGRVTAAEAISFALSAPIAAVVTGITRLSDLQQNTQIASAFVPLSKQQTRVIESRFNDPTISARYGYFANAGHRDGHLPA